MSSTVADILNDLRETLAGAGDFSAVLVAPVGDSTYWPRAELTLSGLDERPADDRPGGRWTTIRARVCIHVRDADPAAGLVRALELAEAAGTALLADRFRGQRCRDLPTGKATEIGPARVEPPVKAPYLALSFEVRCNFES